MRDARLYQTVAKQILALIEVGEFKPGSRLPGERELAERFGVGRVVVREAEIALEALGHIEVKTGSGAYVLEATAGQQAVLPAVGPFELTEARALFEGESAALAAPIITDDAIAHLEESIEAMAHDVSDEADREFHMTIARATGNPAVISVIDNLWTMREESQSKHSIYKSVCAQDASYRTDEHTAILDALRARDAAGARAAMRQHFTRLIEAMLVATEEEELNAVRRKVSESRARFSISAKIA